MYTQWYSEEQKKPYTIKSKKVGTFGIHESSINLLSKINS